MRARISVHEPIDADLDPGAGQLVSQAIDPVPVDGRHPDAHGTSVAYGLRLSSGITSEAHASIPLSPQPKRKSSAFLAEGVRIFDGNPCMGSGVARTATGAHGRLMTRDFRAPRPRDLGPYGCTREFVHVAPEQPPAQAVEGIGFPRLRRAAAATCPCALTRASDR